MQNLYYYLALFCVINAGVFYLNTCTDIFNHKIQQTFIQNLHINCQLTACWVLPLYQ